MQPSTKRRGIAIVVSVTVVVALVVLAATAIVPSAKPVAVVVTAGPRAAVEAKSIGDWPSSTLTTSTAALHVIVPAPVPTAVTPTPNVQPPSNGAAGSHSVVSIPSGFPPVPLRVPPTITVPPEPTPVTTPTTMPTTTALPTANHITVTLQLDPPAPRVGETVHFTLRAIGGAWCCFQSVHFNDGSPPWIPLGQHDTGPCPAVPGPPSGTYSFTHVFAAPGVFTVEGEADGGSTCLAPPNFEWVYGRSSTVVTVSP